MESDDPFGNVEPYIPPPAPEGLKFFKATPFSWSAYLEEWRWKYLYRKANPPLPGGIVVDGLHIPEHGLHAKRGGMRWGEPKPQRIKPSDDSEDLGVVEWLKAEMRRMLDEEVGWALTDMILWGDGGPEHVSDLLMSDIRLRENDGVLYIEYPDGRKYVADLCTPIYDKLREESKWESDF